MSVDLQHRHFLQESAFTRPAFDLLLDLAAELKAQKRAGGEIPRIAGRNIALIFEKTSTRTRCAFEVAAYDQGANVTYLDPSGSQMGHKESVADTARVLGRMYDAIEYRGSSQANVEELARHAGVPVYNGLTDEWHPTQMLADFLTMREHSRLPSEELSYAYVGDCRYNMGHSLLIMGALMGADVRLAAPPDLQPSAAIVDLATTLAAGSGARVTVTDDPREAVDGAQFVHTDVWVSMGEPKDVWVGRAELLRPYRVDVELMAATGNGEAKFMHCLPAFHDQGTVVGAEIMAHTGMTDGLEVTHEVFESDASIVFDQAENRLHTIKALLVATLS